MNASGSCSAAAPHSKLHDRPTENLDLVAVDFASLTHRRIRRRPHQSITQTHSCVVGLITTSGTLARGAIDKW